jgi:hypothetical protein
LYQKQLNSRNLLIAYNKEAWWKNSWLSWHDGTSAHFLFKLQSRKITPWCMFPCLQCGVALHSR